MPRVLKIISGGQVGADIAGLRAGTALGLETGGWMPQGFRTLQGQRPEYAQAYGVREHECRGYPPRTRANVRDSDGTVRFAYNFASPGERCTRNAISEFRKPYLDIAIYEREPHTLDGAESYLLQWLDQQNIQILNVAGNASFWIEPIVEQFLMNTIPPLRPTT